MNRYIDHTLLKPDARAEDIHKLCHEAINYRFFSVCVNSLWVSECDRLLQGSGVQISVVCGFPLGASLSRVKVLEASLAARNGATEIDMVLPIGLLIAGEFSAVCNDIRQVVEVVRGQAIVKVILETGLLTDEQKRSGCHLAEQAGAHYVKTSTGFGSGGATVEDVRLLRESVSSSIGVKASGGIRDLSTAQRMIKAGATRLGTSAGVAIMKGLEGSAVY